MQNNLAARFEQDWKKHPLSKQAASIMGKQSKAGKV